MITYDSINALPTTGVSLTLFTSEGIRTYTYECHTSTTLAQIINDTMEAMASGDRLVSVSVA